MTVARRLEPGTTFQQLAPISNKARPDSARVALHRALVRLAEEWAVRERDLWRA